MTNSAKINHISAQKSPHFFDFAVTTQVLVQVKPEPIMLLILPIILSRISHIFHPLFFIYSHAITYYSIIIPQI